jgi:hypothetical protein
MPAGPPDSLLEGSDIRVQRNARFIQVSNTTFYKGRLVRRAPDANGKRKPEPTARLSEVAEFIEKTARKRRTLVVTNKPVRCALTGEDEHASLPISAKYRGADIAHFGNIHRLPRAQRRFAGGRRAWVGQARHRTTGLMSPEPEDPDRVSAGCAAREAAAVLSELVGKLYTARRRRAGSVVVAPSRRSGSRQRTRSPAEAGRHS